jgi:hypothetical protein
MSTMLVKVYTMFEVEYHGEQYREHALNRLQVSSRDGEGAGPAGSYRAKEITEKHPSATYAVEVISDIK